MFKIDTRCKVFFIQISYNDELPNHKFTKISCLSYPSLLQIFFNHNKNMAKEYKKIRHFTVNQYKNIGKNHSCKPNFQHTFQHAGEKKPAIFNFNWRKAKNAKNLI